MKNKPTVNDFERIIVEDIPLMDVRAPVEFTAGAFPTAVNLPILNDEDRHLVGLCYKQKGRDAAFNLAYSRVSGVVKEKRVADWVAFHQQNPTALFYCFRGGMRSKSAQQWFYEETGITVERLEGGYKALRRFHIEALDPGNVPGIPVILGGRTGAGKTVLLKKIPNAIDLEGAANHRGSAFGAYISPQPSQIDFENRIAASLIKHRQRRFKYLVLEDEGNYIGGRYIPHDLARYFKRESMVLLESELDERIERTYQEYVVDAQQQYLKHYGSEHGLQLWLEYMQSRMQRIRKRLGGERFKRVLDLLQRGQEQHLATGQADGHKKWIVLLLTEYYDPMYDYQIEKSGRKIDFKGSFAEVLTYLRSLEERSTQQL